MPQFSLWIWLGVIVVAAVIELMTFDLTSIWFAISGVVALVLSAIDGISWDIQLIVFIVLSAVLIVAIRPIAKKFLFRHMNDKTNAASIVGKKVAMLSTASFGVLGSVKIADVVWSAIPTDETETIEEGTIVEIVEIRGNKLVVKKYEK